MSTLLLIASAIIGGTLLVCLGTGSLSISRPRSPNPKLHTTSADHSSRLTKVVSSLRSRRPGSKISLHKRSLVSNTIRNGSHKIQEEYHAVDLSGFTKIIEICHPGAQQTGSDPSAQAQAQGLTQTQARKDDQPRQRHEGEHGISDIGAASPASDQSQGDGLNYSSNYGHVTCEPGMTFGRLVPELLKYGLTPLVVIEFPEITIGGAISGGGLESASHRYGQFMDTVLEIECVMPTRFNNADGASTDRRDSLANDTSGASPRVGPGAKVYKCSPSSNPDLFYALSASYNTVALITSVTFMVKPAKPFVHLSLERFTNFEDAVRALSPEDNEGETSAGSRHGFNDTLEGIAFAEDDIVVIRGKYTDVPGSEGGMMRFSKHWDRWYYKVIKDLSRGVKVSGGSSGDRRRALGAGMDSLGNGLAQNKGEHADQAGTQDNDGSDHDPHAHAGADLTVPYLDYSFRYNHGAFWMASFILDLLGDSLVTRFLFGWLLDTKHLFAVLHSSKLADLGRMRVIQDCYIPVGPGDAIHAGSQSESERGDVIEADAGNTNDKDKPSGNGSGVGIRNAKQAKSWNGSSGEGALGFLQWEAKEIGVWPLWLCPVRGVSTPQWLACNHVDGQGRRDATSCDRNLGQAQEQEQARNDPADTHSPAEQQHRHRRDFINVGIYGRPSRFPFDAPALNDSLVEALIRYKGRSMLYAQTWHTPKQFSAIYGNGLREIDNVKRKYSGVVGQGEGGATGQDGSEGSDEDCFYGLYDKVALKRHEREDMAIPIVVDERGAGGGRGSSGSAEQMENEAHWRILRDIVKSKLGMGLF